MLNRILNKLKRPNHTRKRLWNACLNYISKTFKTPYVLGFPESILIEPTNLCNLKCPLCPTGSGKTKRDKGFLSFKNFRKVIDDVGDYVYHLTLNNCGEPFLNKDIFSMISYAKGKGLTINLATNAQLIDRSCAGKIVDSGLDRIVISLDGATQESYERYKIGGSLQKVIDAIKFIRQARNEKTLATPSIEIQFIIMKHNEDEAEAVKKLAKTLRADRLVFKKLCDLHGIPEDLEGMEGLLPRRPADRAYKTEGGRVKWNSDREDKNFCAMAWNYPAVNWNGSLYPCCFNFESFNLGNVLESGFRTLWNARKFMVLRRNIRRSKSSLAVCSTCPVNFYDQLTWDVPMEDTAHTGYDARKLAEFCDYHPRFGAVADDIIASQYGMKDDRIIGPTNYYFFYNKLLNLVRSSISESSAVIDIGCGAGILADALTGRYKSYVGVDISAERIRQARARIKDKKALFTVADAGSVPCADSSFDAAVSIEVIEHLWDAELLIKEARRVLKEGGVFILTTPTGLWYENITWQLYRDPHLHEFSYRKLKELLERQGFQIKSLSGIGFKLPKIKIHPWLGSDVIKYIYSKIKRVDLKAGYGRPIVLQFNIMAFPLFDKLYFTAIGRHLWSWLVKFFGYLGARIPALSSNMVIICKK